MKTTNNSLTNHLKSQHTLHEFEMTIATLVSERDEVAAERDEVAAERDEVAAERDEV
ncbi:hypothetical protein [Vibrio vulnificus]|uniref:hypothetical protein n=1 Tax=Vibrio vulnificus TaxID=672 RepID=UPI00165DC406|nr:hypothetical protein [Vibrio vulnificus]